MRCMPNRCAYCRRARGDVPFGERGDHYAYVDRNVHQLNYLRYSDEEWQRWNNAFLYQNRLRAHWFVDGARRHGFDIDLDTRTTRERSG